MKKIGSRFRHSRYFLKKICALPLLAAALLSAALLSGCHGQREQAAFTVPERFDSSKNYEITFWAKNDTNVRQTDIYKQAIADFQELYPNITVNLRLYTDYGKIYNDVITNISTGTTPNVCITYPDHIATYLTGDNVVVPLDDLFSDPAYGLGGSEVRFDSPAQSEIIPQFLEECRIGGYYYAVPYMRSTEACYINKDYVEALGYTLPETLTWDFIWEVSEAAAAKNADGTFALNGQEVLLPFIYKSTDNMMIQMLKQKGAGYSTASGEIQIFNDTTTELLYTIAEHTESGAFSTFKISGYPANFLNAGQCVFAIDSTAGATWMGSDAPLVDIAEENIVDFETAVMPVPQFDPENPQMISQGPSICIFNKEDPQEVLASWLFTQFLLTNEVQIAYSQTEGYVPVTSAAQNTQEYQDYLSRAGEDNDTYYRVKIEASRLLLDHMDDTFITPVFNGSTSLRDTAGELIEEVTKGVRRHQTVDDAFIEELYEEQTSLHHLNETSASGSGKTDLGPLPPTAVTLLSCLAGAWVLILLYLFVSRMKKTGKKR
ncbi:MAG TPA: extracellular solute-binding protein [Candidatus Eisenbergiella pullistercoris]|uniref:Extracellular solute-binding protein n=1 Tax=Candidatus Eisenbergiella pullistercoris TaxID=2838555 RepID=A0A9D2C7Q1_9FIRM|nr:extracellular solute-binding protein [Candidatus Eisenbergiella pullistercoris]